MSYTKQNFRSKEKLYASQLNAMDDQIYNLTEVIENGVITDTTLTKSGVAADAKTVGDKLVQIESSCVATAEQIETNKNNIEQLSNQIDTERAERQAEIAVERARINTFTALAEGSTTGDAELLDSRVGHDGTVYETAGEAVRGQAKQITANMEAHNFGNLIDKTKLSDHMLGISGNIAENEKYCHTDFIKVVPGETLKYKAYCDNPTNNKLRFVTAYDQSKVVIQDKGTNVNKDTYTVPEGVAFVRVTIDVADKDYAVIVSGELPESYIPYTGFAYYALPAFLNGCAYTKEQTDEKFNRFEEQLVFQYHRDDYPNVYIPLTFEQGRIDKNTGLDTDVEYSFFIRSIGYFTVKSGDKITVTLRKGYGIHLLAYAVDGTYIGRTYFGASKIITVSEDCLYRVEGYSATFGTGIFPNECPAELSITTAAYKQNKNNGVYIKEAERVVSEALDETSHIRLFCFADPHSFDTAKYRKYDEIMKLGVADYLIGLGDYIPYTSTGTKNDYRQPTLDSINLSGRESNRIYVTGNHDVSMRGSGHSKDMLRSPMETFDLFYRHLKNGMVCDPENPYGGYFYIDDSVSKIRLIILNSSELFEDNGNVIWCKSGLRMSQRQVSWFANTALKANEDGWSAVVFAHSDLACGPYILFEIMSAAKDKTSFNKTWTEYRRLVVDENGNALDNNNVDKNNGETYTIVADYSDGNAVHPMAIVHGDTHAKDWIQKFGITSICIRNDGVHLDDRYVVEASFNRNASYYFVDVYGHLYSLTTPDTDFVDNAVKFEYNAYLTQTGNSTSGWLIDNVNNTLTVNITAVSSAPSGANELTGFVRERDGSLVGDENCEILCINKDTRTITTIPYGTGSKRVISY